MKGLRYPHLIGEKVAVSPQAAQYVSSYGSTMAKYSTMHLNKHLSANGWGLQKTGMIGALWGRSSHSCGR